MPIEWDLYRRIVIKNLWDTPIKEEIENWFCPMGRIVKKNFFIAREPQGFALLQYVRRRDAKRAVSELNGIRIYDRRIEVELSVKSLRCYSCFQDNNWKKSLVAKCGHVFCSKCCDKNVFLKCPKCKLKINKRKLQIVFPQYWKKDKKLRR